MNQKSKKHNESHQHGHAPSKTQLHKDWRAWAVVGLMLAALAIYVLTMDESFMPGGGGPEEPPTPAMGE